LTPLAAFLISEPAAGRDFNNDGDTLDNVAVVYDPLHHHLMNTHQEADSFNFSNNIMTFVTNEARQGQDLNGDGKIQATDNVLQSYDPLSNLPFGKLSNLGKVLHFARTEGSQATIWTTRSSRCRIFVGSGQPPQPC
jgi:hypothetical protein